MNTKYKTGTKRLQVKLATATLQSTDEGPSHYHQKTINEALLESILSFTAIPSLLRYRILSIASGIIPQNKYRLSNQLQLKKKSHSLKEIMQLIIIVQNHSS